MSKYFNVTVRDDVQLGGNAYARSQIYAGARVSVRKVGSDDMIFPPDIYVLNSDIYSNSWIKKAHEKRSKNIIGGHIL